jgi:hypothetical protein
MLRCDGSGASGVRRSANEIREPLTPEVGVEILYIWPGTLVLLGLGLPGVAFARRRLTI